MALSTERCACEHGYCADADGPRDIPDQLRAPCRQVDEAMAWTTVVKSPDGCDVCKAETSGKIDALVAWIDQGGATMERPLQLCETHAAEAPKSVMSIVVAGPS